MKKLFIIYSLFILFFFYGIVLRGKISQYAGIRGANFLKVGTSPRAEGMGTSFVSLLGGVNSISYNPAGVNNIDTMYFLFSSLDWIDNVTITHFAYAQPYKKWNGNLFGSFSFLYVTPIIHYDSWGEGIDKMDFYNFALTGGYATIYKNYYIGGSLKLLYQKIYTENNFGLGLDLGGIYKVKPFRYKLANKYWINPDDLKVGFVIRNLGTKAGADYLPLEIDFGSSLTLIDNLLFSLTIVKPLYTWASFVDLDYKLNFGFEYNFLNIIFIRTGLKLFYDVPNNFSFGIGIEKKFFSGKLIFDYSYAAYTYLEKTNRFALILKLYKWKFWKNEKKKKYKKN